MKTFRFKSFTVSSMGSWWDEYTSTGKDLKEAKENLVKKLGCTKDYFDDPEYNKITQIQ